MWTADTDTKDLFSGRKTGQAVCGNDEPLICCLRFEWLLFMCSRKSQRVPGELACNSADEAIINW